MAQFRRPIQQEAEGSIPLLHDNNELERKGFLESLRLTWNAIFSELRGPQRLWTTLLATLLTSISPLLGGYTLGFASSALLQLNDPGVPTKYNIQGINLALFAGLTTGGAAIGGFLAGYAADYLGRKSALLVSAVLGMIGWLLLMSANFWTHGGDSGGFVLTLLIGRFFTGGALGWGMLCSPLYVGEISPPGLRGLFGSFPQLALTFGFFLVYGLGAIPGFSYEYISLVAASITTLFVVLLVTPLVPMTPRFLIMKGRWEEALHTLRWLRGPHVQVDEEAEEIRRVLASTERLTCRGFCSELKKQKSIISIILMVFMMAFQQFSGIHVLAIFAGDIFKDAGFQNPQFIATMSNVASTVMTILSIFFVDLFGRKVLLFISGSAMIVGSFGLGTYFFFVRCATNTDNATFLQATVASPCNSHNFQWMIITFFVIHTVGFSIGWGTIPFILNSELFPLQIRGSLAGVATAVNWACSALVSTAYAPFAKLVFPYSVWWGFGIANLISTVCVAVFLPETKGEKLEEIEQFLQRRYRPCQWKQMNYN